MKKTLKYTVGALVRIKKGLKAGTVLGGLAVVPAAEAYAGKRTCVICAENGRYKLHGVNFRLWWSAEMLEPVEEPTREPQKVAVRRAVRCKDCKHQRERKGWGLICSRHNYSAVEPEGFCSWGEAKE